MTEQPTDFPANKGARRGYSGRGPRWEERPTRKEIVDRRGTRGRASQGSPPGDGLGVIS